jgi:hypothetical protein
VTEAAAKGVPALLRQAERGEGVVVARMLGDTGARVDLDDAIAALGFDRADLERELGSEIAADTE